MLQFGDIKTASVKPGLTDDDLISVERNDIHDLARAVEQIELGLQSTPLELRQLHWLTIKETVARLSQLAHQ